MAQATHDATRGVGDAQRNSWRGRHMVRLMAQHMVQATHDPTCGVGDTVQLIPWATQDATRGAGDDARRDLWRGGHTARPMVQVHPLLCVPFPLSISTITALTTAHCRCKFIM